MKKVVLFLFFLLAPFSLAGNQGYTSSDLYNVYIEDPSSQTSSDLYNVQVGQTSVAGYASSDLYNVFVEFDSVLPVAGVFPASGAAGGAFSCSVIPSSFSLNGKTFQFSNGRIVAEFPMASSGELVVFFSANCGGVVSVSPELRNVLSPKKPIFSASDQYVSFSLDSPALVSSFVGVIFLGNRAIEFELRTKSSPYFKPTGLFALTFQEIYSVVKSFLNRPLVCFGSFSGDCLYRFSSPLIVGAFSIFFFRIVDLLVSIGLIAVLATRFKRKEIILLLALLGVFWFAVSFF